MKSLYLYKVTDGFITKCRNANAPQRCSVLPVKPTRRMKATRNMSAAVDSVCVCVC